VRASHHSTLVHPSLPLSYSSLYKANTQEEHVRYQTCRAQKPRQRKEEMIKGAMIHALSSLCVRFSCSKQTLRGMNLCHHGTDVMCPVPSHRPQHVLPSPATQAELFAGFTHMLRNRVIPLPFQVVYASHDASRSLSLSADPSIESVPTFKREASHTCKQGKLKEKNSLP
jgi:hypothetical protein